jgi:hypothetical protein
VRAVCGELQPVHRNATRVEPRCSSTIGPSVAMVIGPV